MSVIEYPVGENGRLVSRGGALPPFPKQAPAAHQPGSLHWAAILMYGDVETFVQTVESVVAGQGQLAEAEWQRFCVLYREWQRQARAGELSREPSLNDVAVALRINTDEFFGRLANAVQGLFAKIGQAKLIRAIPRAADLTVAAMEDLENGFDDRQVVLRLGGLVETKGGGITINNNTQVGVKVDVPLERLAGPLGQFRDTVDEIDSAVREAALLPPASMEGIIDGSLRGANDYESGREAVVVGGSRDSAGDAGADGAGAVSREYEEHREVDRIAGPEESAPGS